MRHMEIRDMYSQKEVSEGKVEVSKTPGEESPADLMTKILGCGDSKERLERMSIRVRDISHEEGSRELQGVCNPAHRVRRGLHGGRSPWTRRTFCELTRCVGDLLSGPWSQAILGALVRREYLTSNFGGIIVEEFDAVVETPLHFNGPEFTEVLRGGSSHNG